MQRPPDIHELRSVIDRLVTHGGVKVPAHWRAYLASVGVAASVTDGDWMYPTQPFLQHALPARDLNDLVRRVAVRDPLYRLHVDLCLCSVIHSVAISERWNRMEELLFGPCRPIAPRLVQLLTWFSRKFKLAVRKLPSSNIQQVVEDGDDTFPGWDRKLWGDSRSPADLFPLLLDLYVPLGDQPWHVSADVELDHALLASLIGAARDGEGLALSTDNTDDLDAMQRLGLPVRVDARANDTIQAFAVGAIELVGAGSDRIGEPVDIPFGLSGNAKQSRVVPPPLAQTRWSVHESSRVPVIAPISIDHEAGRWPVKTDSESPEWLRLPGSELISTAAKRRQDSQDADEALEAVASHPLYGFLLQLLLLEALDRELGEETLALALPQNRKLETADDWSETTVLYRPREESKHSDRAEGDGFLVIGSIDDIVPKIAHEVGILGVATPYETDQRPWSRAIYLMSTAGIVDGRPHSWRLTITTFILDRLHSGTLMKDVIRGGRDIRDRIHHVLLTLWKEQTTVSTEEKIPA